MHRYCNFVLTVCSFNFESGRPYYHFDTFPVAMITVFQVTAQLIRHSCKLQYNSNIHSSADSNWRGLERGDVHGGEEQGRNQRGWTPLLLLLHHTCAIRQLYVCIKLYASLMRRTKHTRADTLLNVFLAIAVDNLANAQELTAAEEADEKNQDEVSS